MVVAGWGLVALGVLLAAPAPLNSDERLLASVVKLAAGVALILVGVNFIAL